MTTYFREIRPNTFLPIGDPTMPRRSTAKPSTTVAELEPQLATDTELTTPTVPTHSHIADHIQGGCF